MIGTSDGTHYESDLDHALSGWDTSNRMPLEATEKPAGAFFEEGRYPSSGAFAQLIEKGNIDLTNRPQVKNPDGSVSTVRSMSFGTDKGEVLVPTVHPDGYIMSDEEAIKRYEDTGEHLGIFKTPADADAYGKQLHKDQEEFYGLKPQSTNDSNPFKAWDKLAMDVTLKGRTIYSDTPTGPGKYQGGGYRPANENNKGAESIGEAAIKLKDGTIVRGKSHFDAIVNSQGKPYAKNPDWLDKAQDGFVTSAGRFVDRKEAAKMIQSDKDSIISEDITGAARPTFGKFRIPTRDE